MRTHLFSDVQELEGVNSLVRVANTRCPNIGLPLLNARVALKKALGLGHAEASTRWTDIREPSRRLLQTLVNNADNAGDVLNDAGYWTAPVPTPGVSLVHRNPANSASSR
jgi:hypothetical protein